MRRKMQSVIVGCALPLVEFYGLDGNKCPEIA